MVTSNIVIPCMFASHRRYNALLPVIHGDGCIPVILQAACALAALTHPGHLLV